MCTATPDVTRLHARGSQSRWRALQLVKKMLQLYCSLGFAMLQVRYGFSVNEVCVLHRHLSIVVSFLHGNLPVSATVELLLAKLLPYSDTAKLHSRPCCTC